MIVIHAVIIVDLLNCLVKANAILVLRITSEVECSRIRSILNRQEIHSLCDGCE